MDSWTLLNPLDHQVAGRVGVKFEVNDVQDGRQNAFLIFSYGFLRSLKNYVAI